MDKYQLDELDMHILRMIAENARVPFLEVARACKVSGAAIHQRVQRLTSMGVLLGTGYFIDPFKIGYNTCAYIGLNLKNPSQFEAAMERLKGIPEVVECHYTSGPYDIFIKVYARNNLHLLSIIHDQLQPIGLSHTETIISFKETRQKQVPITLSEK